MSIFVSFFTFALRALLAQPNSCPKKGTKRSAASPIASFFLAGREILLHSSSSPALLHFVYKK
ncbi:hypothetical protein TRIATDRAFT_301732 [Trichoderma atroviride IMI 206040]|uniref:Uncharacterized protein n=1 Tax=Hypocrea atroviridis (strain ATCC 20476 / IMI 206040) TaxID=452589 RepID=G9P8Z4_HYPAI|nr:uncharacterized protein TRIATDRAFT_301732 [Trichoderma atroviride IMI 206040]EHK41022.1 hypothetical protein TRIATDRAFT_301732 [Trichoderma atroviride IMI 206040]